MNNDIFWHQLTIKRKIHELLGNDTHIDDISVMIIMM